MISVPGVYTPPNVPAVTTGKSITRPGYSVVIEEPGVNEKDVDAVAGAISVVFGVVTENVSTLTPRPLAIVPESEE